MKFFLDFFPVLLFFIAYKVFGIYIATAISIAASFLQVAYIWLKHKRVENMQLVMLVLLTVFGGLTLFLQDDTFIKWKPTAINGLFALVFLGSQFIGEKSIVERMLGANMSLPKKIWNRLNFNLSIFFAAIAVLNIYIAFHFSTDTWVNFKLFGITGLTIVFFLAQGLYISRFMEVEEEAQNEEN